MSVSENLSYSREFTAKIVDSLLSELNDAVSQNIYIDAQVELYKKIWILLHNTYYTTCDYKLSFTRIFKKDIITQYENKIKDILKDNFEKVSNQFVVITSIEIDRYIKTLIKEQIEKLNLNETNIKKINVSHEIV